MCGRASVRGWGCARAQVRTCAGAGSPAHVRTCARGHLPDGPRRRSLRAKRLAAELYPLVQSFDQWSKSGQTVCGDRQPLRAGRRGTRTARSLDPDNLTAVKNGFVLLPNGGRRDGGRSNAGPEGVENSSTQNGVDPGPGLTKWNVATAGSA